MPNGYSASVQLFTTKQHVLSNLCRSFSLHEYELRGMQSSAPMGSYWKRGKNYERKIFIMKNRAFPSLLMLFSMTFAGSTLAQNPMVGGHDMSPMKTIVQNAVNSDDHTTLVAAVKAAGLVDTLQGAGPFTVFAPTNEAFAKLPAGTVDTLLKPENKDQLTKVLTYHVVAGKVTSDDLAKKIKEGHGTAALMTVEGGKLEAMMQGSNIVLKDEKGGTATVSIANVMQSNGVIHVIDSVLLP